MLNLLYLFGAAGVPIQNPEKPNAGLDDIELPLVIIIAIAVIAALILIPIIFNKIQKKKEDNAEDLYVCNKCGRVVTKDDVFCPKCGTNLYNTNDNSK